LRSGSTPVLSRPALDYLIAMKAATGRDKDRRALTELMVLADEIGRRERGRTNDS
jgi:hypothetical protein